MPVFPGCDKSATLRHRPGTHTGEHRDTKESTSWEEPSNNSAIACPSTIEGLAMATQIVMDLSGDTRHDFDANDEKALLEAEERFRMLTGRGFTAATRRASGEPVVSRKFDPTAEETLFFPRLVGG